MSERLILASSSPRRSELLKSCHIDFIVTEHEFDENSLFIKSPFKYALIMAEKKAQSIAVKMDYYDDYILGSDTIVVCKNKILGKPSDKKDAEQMLRLLSDRKHSVITGLSIINNKKSVKITDYAVTNVYFSKISDNFIEYYINNDQWSDYAGGYAIQGIFSLIVKKINGSYSNVVGLPLELLYKMLKKINFKFNL
ncbi:MAG: septum formation protein Maf [Spirochaetes bacterium]|nr:septum formation protein Maf [Spirochaetota bacterium]